MIFSKKVVKKQLFWVSRFWIIQLWTGLGPKILKVSLRSTCVLKKLEHKFRNELWARRLASILSDSKFSEFFLQSITQNCQKRRILALYQITWDFDMEHHIQGTTMWSLTSRRFRKCGSFWNASFPAKKFSQFHPTLTANNYGLKPLNLENYNIFGMLWTCPLTWYHPRWVIHFQNFE